MSIKSLRENLAHAKKILAPPIAPVATVAEVEVALVEVDALKTATEWQPIETAPKDGSAILLLSAPYEDNQTGSHPAKVAIGHWWAEGSSWVSDGPHKEDEVYSLQQTGVWLSGGGWFQPNEVTHWMPLPAAPKEGK